MRIRSLVLVSWLGALAIARAAAQAPPTSLVPRQVAISVADAGVSARWYVDHLGFRVETDTNFPDHHMRIAMVQRDGFRLELVQLEGSKAPSELIAGEPNPARIRGFGKLAFTVPDIAAAEASFRARRARFALEPRTDTAHATRSFIVLDPDGNWIQLTGAVNR